MKKNNKGFTLVELLAVIVIMGILMMVAIPSITRTIENSRKDTFVDIAKSYASSARSMWTTDNLTCNGVVSSAVDDGDYYILINSKESAKDGVPALVDQGGKSSWGNRDVNGYVRVNVSTTSGVDNNGDGIYEVEPKRITKFYVALSDGTHGLIDDDTLTMDELKRGNVNMALTPENVRMVELTTDDGFLDCLNTSRDMYYCVNVAPVKDITGICIDNNAATNTVGYVDINPVDFVSDDWVTIAVAIKSGDHPYHVGDSKTVDMGSFGTHTLRISNLEPCDGSLKSETACGAVFEFVDVVTGYSMNSTSTSANGWPVTELRKYLNSTIYNALPRELSGGIINTRVVSGHDASDSSNFTTSDKLYLLSPTEIVVNDSSEMLNYDTARNLTRQLDYYTGLVVEDTATVARKKMNGSYKGWWLRTAVSNYSEYYYILSARGRLSFINANDTSTGISPAFRIA